MTLGVSDGIREFGRCLECACDLMRSGQGWKRLPRGFTLVSETAAPRQARQSPEPGPMNGSRVNLHDVEIVGERVYGDQRFALVILDGNHSIEPHPGERSSEKGNGFEYAHSQSGLFDQAPLKWKARQTSATADLFDLHGDDDFEWERAYTGRGQG